MYKFAQKVLKKPYPDGARQRKRAWAGEDRPASTRLPRFSSVYRAPGRTEQARKTRARQRAIPQAMRSGFFSDPKSGKRIVLLPFVPFAAFQREQKACARCCFSRCDKLRSVKKKPPDHRSTRRACRSFDLQAFSFYGIFNML